MTNYSEEAEYEIDSDLVDNLIELGFSELGEVEKLSSFGFILYDNDFGVEVHQENGGSGYYIFIPTMDLGLYCPNIDKLTFILESMPLDLVSEDPSNIVSTIVGIYDPFDEENMFNSTHTVFHRMVNDKSYEDTDIVKKHKKTLHKFKHKKLATAYSVNGKIFDSGEVEDENENDVKISGNWYSKDRVKFSF